MTIDDKDVWVVIPAYNEGERIGKVIKEVKRYCERVAVVDDGSKDDTAEIAEGMGAVVLRHMINLGKGAALKTGCDFAAENGAEKIIVIDADGQHEPKEIPNFLKALDDADIVFSYRRIGGQMPFVLRIGNRFINLLAYMLYGVKLGDTQCGYRAFNADAYRQIRWNASDYSMESEMIANMRKSRLKYKQIPIQTIYLDRYKGTTVIEGVKIVFKMIGWRLLK